MGYSILPVVIELQLAAIALDIGEGTRTSKLESHLSLQPIAASCLALRFSLELSSPV